MKIKAVLTRTALAMLLSANASAFEYSGELDGVYQISYGLGQSQEIGALTSPDPQDLEQIGTYLVFLARQDWEQLPILERNRIRRYILVSGAFRGEVTSATSIPGSPLPFLQLSHVLGTSDRTGAIITANDTLIPTTIGVEVCDPSRGLVKITGKEQLNPVEGFGSLGNLTGGRFIVNTVINQCSFQNDFQFVPKASFVCYGTSQACPQ